MSRAQSAVVWLLLVLGTIAGLVAGGAAVFSSAAEADRRIQTYAYQLPALDAEAASLPIVKLIPEDARDIRVVWQADGSGSAAAWHAPADLEMLAECSTVENPKPPSYADRLVILGPDPYVGFVCGEFTHVVTDSTIYTWSSSK